MRDKPIPLRLQSGSVAHFHFGHAFGPESVLQERSTGRGEPEGSGVDDNSKAEVSPKIGPGLRSSGVGIFHVLPSSETGAHEAADAGSHGKVPPSRQLSFFHQSA